MFPCALNFDLLFTPVVEVCAVVLAALSLVGNRVAALAPEDAAVVDNVLASINITQAQGICPMRPMS